MTSEIDRSSDAEGGEVQPLSAEDLANLEEPIDITVEARAHGWRLDHYLNRLFPNHSRSQLQRVIESGGVQLNGLLRRALTLERRCGGWCEGKLKRVYG